MRFGKLFEEFKKLNPWEVVFTGPVKKVLDGLTKEEENPKADAKSNRIVLEITEKAFEILSTFPPDDSFFTDPKPSFHDVSIWVVLTTGHKKVFIKAEYRLKERHCVVTELEFE